VKNVNVGDGHDVSIYMVSHKGLDCKYDLKLLKYEDPKVNLALLP